MPKMKKANQKPVDVAPKGMPTADPQPPEEVGGYAAPVPAMEGGASLPPELEQSDAQLQQSNMERIGAGTPSASEAIAGERINSLSSAVTNAFSELGAGQVEAPPIPPVEGMVTQAPAELFAALAALQVAMQSAADMGVVEARPYMNINVQESLKTQSGIAELEALVNKASMDDKLKAALGGQAMPQQDAPAAPAAPAAPQQGDDLDALLA